MCGTGEVTVRHAFLIQVCESEGEVEIAQSCPTLCDPMDYTIHGILEARILEWVAIPFYRRSSQPRDWTQVSHIAGRFFTSWAAREAQYKYIEFRKVYLLWHDSFVYYLYLCMSLEKWTSADNKLSSSFFFFFTNFNYLKLGFHLYFTFVNIHIT